MRSQKLNPHFGSQICVDSTDSEKEDATCYHNPYLDFNRETYQMSPLLFESDTDDTSQSTEIKCYQEKTITPQSPETSNQQMFDILSTLNDLRDEISNQLDTSSQHNQCCSETFLNSTKPTRNLNETKANTYVSPSPRVTRSKLLNSKILTRSAKRLHNIKDFSNSPRNSRKPRTRKVLNKRKKNSTKDSNVDEMASDSDTNNTRLIETVPQSNVNSIVEKLIQNPQQNVGKFIQPNIVPNIETFDDADHDLDFLNRRLSSDVQIFTDEPGVITISSESPDYTLRVSPDLFENYESSSVSNLCSQNSFDIPNGQVPPPSGEESNVLDDTVSSPNNQHDSTLVPSTPDSDIQPYVTPDVTNARQQLLDKVNTKSVENVFEITANEMFDNVIHIIDSESEGTLTSQRVNDRDNKNIPTAVDKPQNLDKSDVNKRASSQKSTPRKRPEIPSLLDKSRHGYSNTSSTLNRSKWLSKPKSSNVDGEFLNGSSHRCRRLDLWFQDRGSKSMIEGNERKNVLLSSSEDEES